VSAQPNLNPPLQTVSSCSGNPVNLTVLYNTTGFNAYWFLNGNPVTNPVSVSAPGTYMLVAETNPGGSCKDTAFVTLIFNPNYNLGPDTSLYICPGQTADLTVLYNTAGVVPQWSFNGNAVANPGAVTQPGIYRLKVANNYGCNDSAYVTVVYDTTVMACHGSPVNLNSLYNTFGLTAAWTLFGSAVANPSAVALPGTYVLVVTNNQTTCTDTANAVVIFNIRPNLGPDTTLFRCIGDTVNFSNTFGNSNYFSYWTPSIPSAVSSFGVFTYIVIDLLSGCSDSANLTAIFRAKPNLGNDILIDTNCVGTYLNLLTYFNLPPNITQVWTNNGVPVVRPDSVLVTPNITYRLVANNGGCYDTVFLSLGRVFPKPVLTSKEVKKCFPDALLLDTLYPGNFSTVRWTAAGGRVLTPPYFTDTSGTYKVVVSNIYKCSDSATVNFILHPAINAYAGNDTNVVKGASFQLHGSGGNDYLWRPSQPLNNPAIANPIARIFSNTSFYLRVRDSANLNCSDTDTVFVRVFDEEGIYVPNAFTPNADPNRIFIPVYVGIKKLQLFRIYNRWGMMVFETNDMAKGWDGNYKGLPQELGNYVCKQKWQCGIAEVKPATDVPGKLSIGF
jgi:gliding motility-associated-like protein